ncbi:MAG: DUF6074 family protein [Phyllobacterium sp.]
MAELIPFPLQSRVKLVRSIVDDLRHVHGPAANEFWRRRIDGIVAGMRATGLSSEAIRTEILGLSDAVQAELRRESERVIKQTS